MAIADSGPVTTRPAFSAGILRISRDGFTHGLLWTMLLLLYLLSGVLTFATNYVYRMGLMSLLIIPLVFVRGLRIERVLAGFALLTLEVVLSAFYNHSPLGDVIAFMRIPVFAYLMYYLVSVAVDEKNISRILRFLVIVACVQLPVVLLQWWSFDSLPASLKVDVGVIDYGFGTFNYKTDYSLSFLLILLVTWLLFDEKRGRIIRYRWPVILWLSLTVLVLNAQILKVSIVLVWGVYLITHLRLRAMLAALCGAAILWFGADVMYQAGWLTESPVQVIYRFQYESRRADDPSRYLEGNYDRWSGLWFLLSGKVPLLGDGPSVYTDAVTRTMTRGNTGHFFTFFSEVGPLGWGASVLIYALIAFPILRGRLRIGIVPVVSFVVVLLLGFTSQTMNDIAVMFTYCFMIKAVSTAGWGTPAQT
jgi:hypothetical protein